MKKIIFSFFVLSFFLSLNVKTASAEEEECITVAVQCDGENVTSTFVCGSSNQERLNELSEAMEAICHNY